MPRIKLIEQKTYEFRCPIDVQPRDINYGGHLANDTLISIVGSARARMFLSIGLSELNLGDGRTGVAMSDLVVNYKAEAFMFDELLVETHAGEFTRTGFRLFHRVARGTILVALVETGLIAFNYASKKVAPVPRGFMEAISRRVSQSKFDYAECSRSARPRRR
jgi:acyl-CoA thioesterase FadM